MVDILVSPPELRQFSEQLRSSAKKIGSALQSIDNDILSLKGDKFLGNRANTVQAHYAPKREALLKAKDIVLHFAEDLKTMADVFERADAIGMNTFITDPYSWGEFGEDVRDLFVVLAPYSESEAADYLKNTPAGKALIDDLVNAKITVVLPDGTKIGYQGSDGDTITVMQGESIGGGSYINGVITIPNGIWDRARSKEYLASILAHEIQHAYDDESRSNIELIHEGELESYFSKTPEEQADLRERLANELESNNIDSEIRAYERSNSVLDGSGYDDDGVMTGSERQSVLDKRLDFSQDYEKYYEEALSENYPGMEFDVSIDAQGEVQIDIKQPQTRDDDWWHFW